MQLDMLVVGAGFAGEPVGLAIVLYAVGPEVIEIGLDGHHAARALVGVGNLYAQGLVGAHCSFREGFADLHERAVTTRSQVKPRSD